MSKEKDIQEKDKRREDYLDTMLENALQDLKNEILNGATARMMQSAIARVAPEIAQQFLAEAGTQPSLMALAAEQGLTERTTAIDAELAAFRPRTPEQARAERIEELIASRPYGQQGYYNEQGDFVEPVKGDLTKALELEALAPERAQALKLQAMPPAPNPGAVTEEGAAFVNARLASMNAAQGVG